MIEQATTNGAGGCWVNAETPADSHGRGACVRVGRVIVDGDRKGTRCEIVIRELDPPIGNGIRQRPERRFRISSNDEFAEDVVFDVGAFLIAGQLLASGVETCPESAAESAYLAARTVLAAKHRHTEEITNDDT